MDNIWDDFTVPTISYIYPQEYSTIMMLDIALAINGQAYACTPIATPPALWAFPVGDADYPPADWYVASFHGDAHNGIDINLAKHEFGDVERRLGLSVNAIAAGKVMTVVADWYGNPMVVVRHAHEGAPLYVRYAHVTPVVKVGDIVQSGDKLGGFADWRTGDHLHLDMSTTEYTTEWKPWGMLNPIAVFKMHLDAADVDAMVTK